LSSLQRYYSCGNIIIIYEYINENRIESVTRAWGVLRVLGVVGLKADGSATGHKSTMTIKLQGYTACSVRIIVFDVDVGEKILHVCSSTNLIPWNLCMIIASFSRNGDSGLIRHNKAQ